MIVQNAMTCSGFVQHATGFIHQPTFRFSPTSLKPRVCSILANWRKACEVSSTMNPIIIPKTSCRTSSKTNIRRMALLIGTSALILAGATSSCGTAKGFGQDVEKTGDKIQEAATR